MWGFLKARKKYWLAP
ncbi:MAG: hypothetical protein WBA93_12860 [Microcoleaceae cyanobacterium]